VPVLQTQAPLTRVLDATQAVQLEAVVEQLRHEYTQLAQTAAPLSYVPVLQTQAPLTRVRDGSQAVQLEAMLEQLRQEYTHALQAETPTS
jgi:hypothetical protein